MANFAVTGVLCLAGAAGLRRTGDRLAGCRSGPVMVAAAGAGLIGSAAFRTDPVGGYPPGTPDMPAKFSRAGTAQNLAAIPVFFGLPAAAACYGWRSWRAWPAARFRDLQRCHRGDHARHHGAGRSGFRPVIPAGRLRRPVPASQHHHRLRLAHGRVGACTPAHTPRHHRNILICAPSVEERSGNRRRADRGYRASSRLTVITEREDHGVWRAGVGRGIDRGIGGVSPRSSDLSADARSDGHVLGPGRSSLVPARQPSMRPGRYWIFFRPCHLQAQCVGPDGVAHPSVHQRRGAHPAGLHA